ncbi:MAG: non-canonical purine NTP pyrophosphatase [Verrucomicrobia bacterium]|nr:non-canonical purine NTP pyrophosphatase [Verrucomicrobiota bacterium]
MQLLAATRNRHKLGELRAILGSGFEVIGLDAVPSAPDVVEDEPTFAGNAAKKAVWAARIAPLGVFTLADDSGLEVDALGGAPGVMSARYAQESGGPRPNDQQNNAKLLRALAGVPAEKRTARFQCVIAIAGASPALVAAAKQMGVPCEQRDDRMVASCAGTCEGRLLCEPRGVGGFGYDPLFVAVGCELTFAELGEDVKNTLSHRARAMSRVKALLDAVARGEQERTPSRKI